MVFPPFETCMTEMKDPPKCSPLTHMYQGQAPKICSKVVFSFECENPRLRKVSSSGKSIDYYNSSYFISPFIFAALKPKKLYFQSAYLEHSQSPEASLISQKSTNFRMESILGHLAKLSSCFAHKSQIRCPSIKIC